MATRITYAPVMIVHLLAMLLDGWVERSLPCPHLSSLRPVCGNGIMRAEEHLETR